MTAQAKYTLAVIALFTLVCLANIFLIEKTFDSSSIIRNVALASLLCAIVLFFGRKRFKNIKH